MDAFHKDQVIEWYKWLESQLQDIMSVLPPAPENLMSYSPRIPSLILDSCGLMDSVFRQITPDTVIVDNKTKKRSKIDIKDFAKLYSANFDLHNLRSIPFTSPLQFRCPFEPWTNIASGGDYKALEWWKTYNDLKHDRIAHMKTARLNVAIDAICGLHQIISVIPEFSDAILRAGWVDTSGVNPEWLLEIMRKETKTTPFQGYLVESELFILPIGRIVPESIDDFRPSHFNASNRVMQFFGHW